MAESSILKTPRKLKFNTALLGLQAVLRFAWSGPLLHLDLYYCISQPGPSVIALLYEEDYSPGDGASTFDTDILDRKHTSYYHRVLCQG